MYFLQFSSYLQPRRKCSTSNRTPLRLELKELLHMCVCARSKTLLLCFQYFMLRISLPLKQNKTKLELQFKARIFKKKKKQTNPESDLWIPVLGVPRLFHGSRALYPPCVTHVSTFQLFCKKKVKLCLSHYSFKALRYNLVFMLNVIHRNFL